MKTIRWDLWVIYFSGFRIICYHFVLSDDPKMIHFWEPAKLSYPLKQHTVYSCTFWLSRLSYAAKIAKRLWWLSKFSMKRTSSEIKIGGDKRTSISKTTRHPYEWRMKIYITLSKVQKILRNATMSENMFKHVSTWESMRIFFLRFQVARENY